MTDYVKSTNFASKDSLAIGNPLKIVKGTEIDTEFNNIAVAVATKADINSPSFTGTPIAPTPASGDNTTKIATTAFVQAALQAVYPVGSVYINAASATNPATLLGFGTWVEFGAGRVLVGQNASDALFDTLEETGGSKDAIVVSHTHTESSAGSASGTISGGNGGDFGSFQSATGVFSVSGSLGNRPQGTAGGGSLYTTSMSIPDHSHTINSTGSSGTNANVQPYIVVKMWKRTA
jgi:hypothetical protein